MYVSGLHDSVLGAECAKMAEQGYWIHLIMANSTKELQFWIGLTFGPFSLQKIPCEKYQCLQNSMKMRIECMLSQAFICFHFKESSGINQCKMQKRLLSLLSENTMYYVKFVLFSFENISYFQHCLVIITKSITALFQLVAGERTDLHKSLVPGSEESTNQLCIHLPNK